MHLSCVIFHRKRKPSYRENPTPYPSAAFKFNSIANNIFIHKSNTEKRERDYTVLPITEESNLSPLKFPCFFVLFLFLSFFSFFSSVSPPSDFSFIEPDSLPFLLLSLTLLISPHSRPRCVLVASNRRFSFLHTADLTESETRRKQCSRASHRLPASLLVSSLWFRLLICGFRHVGLRSFPRRFLLFRVGPAVK